MVAQTDIARAFDRLAPAWDEAQGPRFLNRIALRMRSVYLRDVCARYARPRVLDVGCGTGQQLLALADRLGAGVGIDVSAAMVERARTGAARRGVTSRVSFEVLAAEEVCRERLGLFDVVLFVGSLEHMRDARLALARAATVLNPSGTLLLVTLHPWHARSWYARIASARGSIPPFRHVTPRALCECARGAGLRAADAFGPDRLPRASGLGRYEHMASQGIAAPMLWGTYLAALVPRS